MQSRLDIILETIDMILEGSKRKWSKEKRVKHARGTADAALNRYNRVKQKFDTYYIRQGDDVGLRGHPINFGRHDAREKLVDMPGTEDQISVAKTTIPALDDHSKSVKRFYKIIEK